jgi:hypothetical protein
MSRWPHVNETLEKHKSTTFVSRLTCYSFPFLPSSMSNVNKGKTVLWALNNVQHILNYSLTPSKSRPLLQNAETSPKSILRKSPQTFSAPAPSDSRARETTPEPCTPSEDPGYLAGPVHTIVLGTESLPNIAEAYSRLCTRLKAMFQSISTMNPEAPVPVLKPIIDSKQGLITACDRDMRRALVNPWRGSDENLPPTRPNTSPKKGGMSDEEAKEARDMHIVCLAALKFTSLLLSSPQLGKLFSTAQLLELVTAVLAIPLTEAMPSLNCRKTYAISIGVLAASTLPAPVAAESSSRITFALRRAIEGELGREGKKGAIADGLKVGRIGYNLLSFC